MIDPALHMIAAKKLYTMLNVTKNVMKMLSAYNTTLEPQDCNEGTDR